MPRQSKILLTRAGPGNRTRGLSAGHPVGLGYLPNCRRHQAAVPAPDPRFGGHGHRAGVGQEEGHPLHLPDTRGGPDVPAGLRPGVEQSPRPRRSAPSSEDRPHCGREAGRPDSGGSCRGRSRSARRAAVTEAGPRRGAEPGARRFHLHMPSATKTHERPERSGRPQVLSVGAGEAGGAVVRGAPLEAGTSPPERGYRGLNRHSEPNWPKVGAPGRRVQVLKPPRW